MENYIESGITWIGKIPSEWKINKIKAMASLSGRIGWQGLTSEEYTDEGAYLITGVDFENGVINWDSCVHVPIKRWKEAVGVQIKENDLLITKDGTVGKVALAKNMPYETSLNSGVLLIRPDKEFDNKFLFYVLRSDVFWTWFNLDNSGNSTITHLYQHNFNNFSFAHPNLKEQIRIVSLLDDKVSNIESIINEYKQQNIILKKYKRSLIKECVTCGIRKNYKIIKTGNKYIPEIPEEWKLMRLKYLADIKTGNTPSMDHEEYYSVDDGIDWIKADNLFYEQPISDSEQKLTKKGIKYGRIAKKHSIIVCCIGSIGKYGCLEKDSAFNQQLNAVYFNDKIMNYRFGMYAIDSQEEQHINIANPNVLLIINNLQHGSVVLPVPSLHEQEEIANYLDEKCKKVNENIQNNEKKIERLEAYKRSLIYEYVTGKKRVEVK